MTKLLVQKLSATATIPAYATDGAACFDLHADNIGTVHPDQDSEQAAVFNTGLAFEVPKGYVMLIFSRSGHGFKDNVRLANCVGVIDSDYRGEVKVKLTQDTMGASGRLMVAQGMRIAQAMLVKYDPVQFEEVDALSTTDRGTGGFGSTGA
jgi:dUTP pyrophosphatase